MPHTSQQRKKKGIRSQKRVAVTDNDGWTHVTTSGNLGRTTRKAVVDGPGEQEHSASLSKLLPAEAPKGLTIGELKTRYQTVREKWENSTCCHVVRDSLGKQRSPAWSFDEHGQTPPPSHVSIICLGLGSPSGFLRGGWVDRRNVSMYQLAALASIMDYYGFRPG